MIVIIKEEKYCFIAFGELAIDAFYDESGITIKEDGGVSAFNTLYNLAVLGQETYAIGGVGTYNQSSLAINSLKDYCVDTDYIEPIDKNTNTFYIYKPSKIIDDDSVKIGRCSPITGNKSIEWTNKLCTNVPDKFKEKNIALIVSNFEPVTRAFVKNVKEECQNPIISLDITNGKIFEQYSAEEILEYLKLFNFIQCNKNTYQLLSKKLGIESCMKLFSMLNADIFTITQGSKGATFLYRDNGNIKTINKKPKIVAPLVDPTGAGDAFHAIHLMSYCKMKSNHGILNKSFFDKAFDIANLLVRKVVQSEGARLKPYDMLFYLTDELKGRKLQEARELLDLEYLEK